MKIYNYLVNPYFLYKKHDGKINLYVGLKRETSPYIHDYSEAIEKLKQVKNIDGGTYLQGIGVYEGKTEPMFQLIFINYGLYATAYNIFKKKIFGIARTLGKILGQQAVLIEEITPEGQYKVSEYVNYRAFKTKKDADKRAKEMRALVLQGIAVEKEKIR
jgi:hypothetical protein